MELYSFLLNCDVSLFDSFVAMLLCFLVTSVTNNNLGKLDFIGVMGRLQKSFTDVYFWLNVWFFISAEVYGGPNLS